MAAVDGVTAGMRSTCDGTVLEMNMAMKVPFATQIVQQVRMRVIRILRSVLTATKRKELILAHCGKRKLVLYHPRPMWSVPMH